MSASLAAIVASAMGPGEVDDLLKEAMRELRAEHTEAKLHSIQLTFVYCERTDGGPNERSLSWSVQVDNARGYGESRAEALKELRERRERAALVPVYAARVASVLRDLDSSAQGDLDHILQVAQSILYNERSRGR